MYTCTHARTYTCACSPVTSTHTLVHAPSTGMVPFYVSVCLSPSLSSSSQFDKVLSQITLLKKINISTLHISLPIGAFDQVCSHHYSYHLLVRFVLLYGLVYSFLHFLSRFFVSKRPLAIEKDFD